MKRLPSAETIIYCWVGNLPDYRVPNKSKPKIDAIVNLFKGFKELGYSAEDITEAILTRITDQCVNKGLKDKDVLKTWIENSRKDVTIAFYKVYPVSSIGA